MSLVSEEIYSSKSTIRTTIIDFLKEYLELDELNFSASSFLSYFVDTLEALSTNLLFYSISTYQEFFTTLARLPESILNLAAFFGYDPKLASPASADVLLTIPLNFDSDRVDIRIPNEHQLTANNISFLTYFETVITVFNNITVRILAFDDETTYSVPSFVDTTNNLSLSLTIPVRQQTKTITEFSIDSSNFQYQFFSKNISLSNGLLTDIKVEVKQPGEADYTEYQKFDSLSVMNSISEGYVLRRTQTGVTIFFGNNLFGIQPEAGSDVRVTIFETLGSPGNVIEGSISDINSIFVDDGGVTKNLNISVTNQFAATGGKGAEGLEDVRENTLAHIISLKRLVSEDDYKNLEVIVDGLSIEAPVPVLKRSDNTINDIQIHTVITRSRTDPEDQVNEVTLVPTRNYPLVVPWFSGQTRIDKLTEVTIGDETYYTLFDMYPDSTSLITNYIYTTESQKLLPLLSKDFGEIYDLAVTSLDVDDVGSIRLRLNYQSTEATAGLTTCTLEILEMETIVQLINLGNYYQYIFPSIDDVRTGELNLIFIIYSPSGLQLFEYHTTAVIRKDLSRFMFSWNEDPFFFGSDMFIRVYDVSLVLKRFYDSLVDQVGFELNVIQRLLDSSEFDPHKMFTDFVNVKFSNTWGPVSNMTFNLPNYDPVINILTSAPIATEGDRYIVGRGSTGIWEEFSDYIAEWDGSQWVYTIPKEDDIVFVSNVGSRYIFTSNKGWIIPGFTLPLQLELEVFRKDSYTGSNTELSRQIKDELLQVFGPRFGTQSKLFRSEIVETVHNINGVEHVNLIKPVHSIFYNYELVDLTEQQLKEYAAEYLFFTSEDITIRIF